MERKYEIELGGKKLIIGVGLFARQANGSCTVQYGDSKVLGTAVMSKDIRDNISYFPLMVDYQEKLYASGKIKSSRFMKREGRPTDESVLTGRMIDRTLRPLFPQHIRNDIQVVAEVLSADEENSADILAMIAASCALSISDIPFDATVAALRIGRVGDEWVVNPTFDARKKSDLDLIVSITGLGEVVMVEAGANEVSEEVFVEGVEFAKKHVKKIVDLINQIKEKEGKEKIDFPAPEKNEDIIKEIKDLALQEISGILYADQKDVRKKIIYDLANEITKKLKDKYEDTEEGEIKDMFMEVIEGLVRDKIMQNEERIGGRKLDEIRPLEIDAGILPRTHGTGYFMRGETQVLTVATLGAPNLELLVENMEEEYKKRFMHHYNFPPYSVGEVQPLRGPSRRDIGHGALAERALQPVMPDKEKFPYTIRLVSEVLGSNGSSSMAATCGSTLALMDAGIPIADPVAGIAMGVVSDDEGNYKILTDIQDLEDTEGGMDFKVAGTKNGITAVQMDTKTHGLSDGMVKDTLTQAKKARLEILEGITKVIKEPRPELSQYAPRITSIKINPEKIGNVIGPGGKTINEIIDKTGVEIDIEDDGQVMITSQDAEAAKKASDWINDLTREAEVGAEYTGKVVKILDFGAFVEIFPGTDGMVHISKLASHRVDKVEDVVKVGDQVKVKVIEIDDSGRINLALVFNR